MKKISLGIILLLCLALVGCSSGDRDNIKVEWDNGTITVNGSQVTVDKYTGSTAEYTSGGTKFVYTYCEADDLSLAIYNSVGVTEDDMSTFKKAKYFQQFLGSELSLYYPLGDNLYNACNAVTDGSMTIEQMCTTAYGVVSEVDFGTIAYVDVNDSIRFKSSGFEVEIRPDEIVIPGYFKISVGTKEECTEPIMIGDTTVQYYNSGNYCYYQYGELLIQTVVGVNLEEHIEFL